MEAVCSPHSVYTQKYFVFRDLKPEMHAFCRGFFDFGHFDKRLKIYFICT